jgi:beta-barrel assembly-enhancing protease
MLWGARRCAGQGGLMVRPVGAIALGVALVSMSTAASADDPASPDAISTDGLRHELQAALSNARENNLAARLGALEAIIDAPSFADLPTSERHAALAEAANGSERLKRYREAESFASRAVALPEQSVNDWRTRLFASIDVGDAPVEVESLTTIGRRWRYELGQLPTSTILTVASDARGAQLGDVRREMLEELFDFRLLTFDGGEPRNLWRDLSLMLLEQGDRDRAIAVAMHVTDSSDIIAMRADNRYKPLLKSGDVPHDPRKAAEAEVDRLTRRMQQYPRSLEVVKNLLGALMRTGQNQKALDLVGEVTRRVEAASAGVAPYDDLDAQYGWVLNSQSRALRNLGRFADAVAPLQRALQWATEKKLGTRVDHATNLAELLCELDRPREALPLLPTDGLSPYGKMRRADVNLMIQMQLGDAAAVESALVELRELSQHSLWTLQRALAVAGRDDEAAALLLSRLRSPQLRADALLELQWYGELPLTARGKEWHVRRRALQERPEIVAVLAQVGKIERYPSIY